MWMVVLVGGTAYTPGLNPPLLPRLIKMWIMGGTSALSPAYPAVLESTCKDLEYLKGFYHQYAKDIKQGLRRFNLS